MTDLGGHGFPKARRLRVRAQYVALKEKGEGFADGPLAASWLPAGALDRPGSRSQIQRTEARVGVTVSSRVGGSVVRNQVKRRLREAIRLELARFPAVELSIVARPSAATASVAMFRAWMGRAAARIAKTLAAKRKEVGQGRAGQPARAGGTAEPGPQADVKKEQT